MREARLRFAGFLAALAVVFGASWVSASSISGGGGAGTLAQTLVKGNTTGGTSIVVQAATSDQITYTFTGFATGDLIRDLNATNSFSIEAGNTGAGVGRNLTLAAGTGATPGDMLFQASGATKLRLKTTGTFLSNATGSALAQNATDGFFYVPTCLTGAPSGTPTAFTGAAPVVVGGDNKLYVYAGGTWNPAGTTYAVAPSGTTATSSGGNSFVVGTSATDNGASNGAVFGVSASVNASSSSAFGKSATAGSGGSDVVVGASASTTSGAFNTVVGASSTTAAGSTTAIGASITIAAGHNGSVAIGAGATTTAASQFVAGTSNNITDVYFGKGVASATPTSYTIHGTGGTGAGIAGGGVVIAGGLSGDAATAGGSFTVQVAKAGTGTSLTTAFVVQNDASLQIGGTDVGLKRQSAGQLTMTNGSSGFGNRMNLQAFVGAGGGGFGLTNSATDPTGASTVLLNAVRADNTTLTPNLFSVTDGTNYWCQMGNVGYRLRSDLVFGWTASATDPTAAFDTGLSRKGAAAIAAGNGSANNASATILCGGFSVNGTSATPTSGNAVFNNTGAVLAQNATDGFLYVPVVNTGAPSGTPTAFTGASAVCVQNTTLYFYSSGAWQSLTSTATSPGTWTVKATNTSATQTLDTTATVWPQDATSNTITVTLPTAASINGRIYTIKKVDSSANAVTVGTTSSQTIDGSTTYVLNSQWSSITVVSNGSNWIII